MSPFLEFVDGLLVLQLRTTNRWHGMAWHGRINPSHQKIKRRGVEDVPPSTGSSSNNNRPISTSSLLGSLEPSNGYLVLLLLNLVGILVA
jgi:hypothetical protein